MMKKIILSSMLIAMFYSNILAKDVPIEVFVEYRVAQNQNTGQYFEYPNVHITALMDNVEIFDVLGNNGDCQFMPFVNPSLPITIKYGQTIAYAFIAKTCRRLLELEVEANDETYNFTFN